MTFQKGDKYWALRKLDAGKPRLFYPDELLDKFSEYWDWNEANPLVRHTLVQKTGLVEQVPLGRPLSINGFCLFAGMSPNTFCKYANEPEYKEIVDVIKNAIYTHKYERAAVGLFSAAIMIRDLGLSEQVTHIHEDKRKAVSDLFPDIEEIDAIVVEETTDAEIKAINTWSSLELNGLDYGKQETDKQELRISGTAAEESI